MAIICDKNSQLWNTNKLESATHCNQLRAAEMTDLSNAILSSLARFGLASFRRMRHNHRLLRIDGAISFCSVDWKLTGTPHKEKMYPLVDLRWSGFASRLASQHPLSWRLPALQVMPTSKAARGSEEDVSQQPCGLSPACSLHALNWFTA